MSGEAIRVLLVDDHAMVRQGLRSYLSTYYRDIEVVGDAGSGEEALQAVRTLSPSVVVMAVPAAFPPATPLIRLRMRLVMSIGISPSYGEMLTVFGLSVHARAPTRTLYHLFRPTRNFPRVLGRTSPRVPWECCPHCRQASSTLSCATKCSFGLNRPFSQRDIRVLWPIPFSH